MATALRSLKRELESLESKQAQTPLAARITNIKSAITALTGSNSHAPRKRRLSAEARAKLSAAAKRRWSGKGKKAAEKS